MKIDIKQDLISSLKFSFLLITWKIIIDLIRGKFLIDSDFFLSIIFTFIGVLIATIIVDKFDKIKEK
ncbi:hypothetical protein OZX68_00805 [Streptococcaceae bacterium ESL0729]|nr:hypothetical protein OZX68_00805 [Streptococcaceae bacterium ESL0729]